MELQHRSRRSARSHRGRQTPKALSRQLASISALLRSGVDGGKASSYCSADDSALELVMPAIAAGYAATRRNRATTHPMTLSSTPQRAPDKPVSDRPSNDLRYSIAPTLISNEMG